MIGGTGAFPADLSRGGLERLVELLQDSVQLGKRVNQRRRRGVDIYGSL